MRKTELLSNLSSSTGRFRPTTFTSYAQIRRPQRFPGSIAIIWEHSLQLVTEHALSFSNMRK